MGVRQRNWDRFRGFQRPADARYSFNNAVGLNVIDEAHWPTRWCGAVIRRLGMSPSPILVSHSN